jgi:hypothetical protein
MNETSSRRKSTAQYVISFITPIAPKNVYKLAHPMPYSVCFLTLLVFERIRALKGPNDGDESHHSESMMIQLFCIC